jgi:uncharacterized membrane protein YfcA
MGHTLFIAGLIGCVSILYATAGQAGGTAFLAVMVFATFPVVEMRATALLLNIVAAGYATWRLRQRAAIDKKLLVPLTAPSLVAAFLGGLLVLDGRIYFILTGLLLVTAAALMVFKRTADTIIEDRPVQLGPVAALGAGAGFISGLTGVGGGVFLTPFLIAFGWTSPRRAAQLSPRLSYAIPCWGWEAFFSPERGLLPAPSYTPAAHSPAQSSARPSVCAVCRSVQRDTFSPPFSCLPVSA